MIYIMISLQEMKLVTLGFSLDKLEEKPKFTLNIYNLSCG